MTVLAGVIFYEIKTAYMKILMDSSRVLNLKVIYTLKTFY